MSKRLILLLAFAFLVGCAVAAYAEVQNVKVSGDLNVLGVTRHFGADRTGIISITRVKVDADLTDNVMTTVRLINERYWGRETDNTDVTGKSTDIGLDLAYVTLKEFLYSPLTLTIGRQELHFGNEMIVGDYDTNNMATNASSLGTALRDPDLSARKAFDAIRATLNYDPLVIDAVYALVSTNNNISDDANDDTLLLGVNAHYKLNAKNTVEGYWFERKVQRKANEVVGTPTIPKKTDVTDVLGARITSSVVDNMILSLEGAWQFGKVVHSAANMPSVDRKAWALETAATYNFSNKKYKPSATALYSYFSGDHENGGYTTQRGTFKGWDPMFENQKSGDIANALLNQTNAHIIGGILTAQAAQDIFLKGEYYAIWWAKAFPDRLQVLTNRADNLTLTERRFVGQEVDLTATYNYTEDVQFSLMGGWLIMGPAIMKETNKVDSEVIGSMKVTF